MKTKTNKTLTILFISILMAFALTACSTFPTRPADQAVRLRADELMKAKINKDWAKAYTFFDESYRKTVSENQFIRKIEKIDIKAFTIESITVEPGGDRVTVKVKSDVSLGGFDFKGNTETQHWIKQDGEWFLQVPPKDTKEFFK